MSDIYLAISETPTVVTLTSAVINSAVASSVTVTNTVTVALDANSLSALENVTVTVGAAITGTVTVGNFPATQAVSLASVPTHAISGTVTANLNLPSFAGGNGDNLTSAVQIGYYDADSGEFRKVDSQYNPLPISGTVTVGNTVTIAGTVTANPTGTQTIAGSVTIGAGTAQIGSVTASISNTVVTVYSAQGTTVSNTNFTSTTASTSLVSAVAGREVLTVFNEGAGNLHISPSATCTTISYQVRLSTGDYWECPQGQLSLAHTAVFATAGTARVTEVS